MLVETDSEDIPGGLVLVPLSLESSRLGQLNHVGFVGTFGPVLRTVREKLAASAPEHFTVEFGVKLGGESDHTGEGNRRGKPEDHDDVGSGR